MDGEQKKGNKLITKERMIPAVVGLIIGIILTCLVGFFMDYFAKSAGIARLRFGDEAIATVDGKAITTQTIYNKAKMSNGLNFLINEVDKIILNDMYELTDKEEEDAKDKADYYINYYASMGYSEEDFLSGNGFANYDEFLDDIRISTKSDKYVYDFLESKLEEGAVKKYYDENKDNIETYDSEHILVEITDTVTDEQALALANEIIGKLNEGKTFDEIVEEYGDKIVHEELGYQGKTASLEQPYIDELVALKDGEYSKTPVKTSYGYHIVHKLATSTFEELRGSIIETLAADLLEADTNLTYKAFIELRDKNNLNILDDDLKKQYQEYKDGLYGTVVDDSSSENSATNNVTE